MQIESLVSDSHLIRPLTFQLTIQKPLNLSITLAQVNSNYSQVVFSLTDFVLRPGQIVSLSNQGITKTHEIRDIAITALYKESDLITGTAEPGSEVQVSAWSTGTSISSEVTVSASETGTWLANFSGSLDLTDIRTMATVLRMTMMEIERIFIGTT